MRFGTNLTIWASAIFLLATFYISPHKVFAEEETSSGFYPKVDLSLNHDNNIYRIERDIKTDTYFLATPSLLYLNLFSKHRLTALYEGAFGFYQEYEGENFNDTRANLDLRLDLSRKLKVNLEGEYFDAHEPRGGEGTKVTLSEEPDLFVETYLNGEVIWGRRTNIAQVSFLLEMYGREYTNNGQEGRSRDWTISTFDIYYNVGPKVSLLAEVKNKDIDYTKEAITNLDSSETYYLVGAKWQATAKTRGVIKAGYQTKDLSEEDLKDYEGFAFMGRLVWEPRSYSRIMVTIHRATKETPQFGTSYYVHNSIVGAFEHDFSSRLTIGGNISARNDDFSNDRKDDVFDITAFVTYGLLRWLDSSLFYSNSTRTSTQENIDYVANTIMLRFTTKIY